MPSDFFIHCGAALGIGIALSTSATAAQTRPQADNRRSTAFALEQQGRNAEAEEIWKSIAGSSPGNAEAYAHLGLLEARQEHYKEAIEYDRKAQALNPRMNGLSMNLGLAYFKNGDLRQAASTFTPLLKAAPPDSPDALRLETLIGLADYGAGSYEASIPHLKKAAAADSHNLEYRMMLAHSCLWTKQYQCVLDEYREILLINPDSAEADMLAGEAYDEMKNESSAIEQFQAAVKADPKLPNAHFGFGYLLWRQAKYDSAESEFKAELENDPAHPLALAYLGDCQMRLNRPDEAIPLLQKAAELSPEMELSHFDLGVIYQQQGKNEDALRELKAAEKIAPEDQKTHWQLGRYYQALGRRDEAKAEFDKTRTLQEQADQSVVERLHQAPPKTEPSPAQSSQAK